MQGLEKLVGMTVTNVQAIKGTDVVLIRAYGKSPYDGVTFVIGCEAECCSRSWFEHVSGVDALYTPGPYASDTVVTSVRFIEMPDVVDRHDEFVQCYGLEIRTNKGRFEIELRNESNGYYGGSFVAGITDVEFAYKAEDY